MATGFVPPATVTDGLASIIIDVEDRTAWASPARARWLVPDHAPTVRAGDTIAITEGPRIVAHLTVSDNRGQHS